MTITAGGKLERRSDKPHVRTVFPPQPPLPNDSASSNLSNITYTEVLSANDDCVYQDDNKQGSILVCSDSDGSNQNTPSTSSLLFSIDSADKTTNVPRHSIVSYDYKQTPDSHDQN